MTFKEYWRRRYEKYKPIYDMFIALYPFTTENLPGEEWLPIPNYEKLYHMSTFGRVKSVWGKEPKILKPSLNGNGYLEVCLCKNGKKKTFLVSRLVAKLFIPNPENKPQVNHVYSRFSNHINCLEWATQSENQKHAVRTGLRKSGEENVLAKLTNEQVLYIRSNPDGLIQKQLAEMFDVANVQISLIQRGKTYKNVGGTIREKIYQHVSDEIREQILARYNAGGISQSALSKIYGTSQPTVCRIIHGK